MSLVHQSSPSVLIQYRNLDQKAVFRSNQMYNHLLEGSWCCVVVLPLSLKVSQKCRIEHRIPL